MESRTCTLTMPNRERFFDQIRSNARYAVRMVQKDQWQGQSVVICGAGPSLADHTLPKADQVWACNSALPYLMDRGERVTHGFCVDQGSAMLAAHEWGRVFDVTYLLASCIHPDLTRHLKHRRRFWFHSYQGLPNPPEWTDTEESYELHLYRTLYGTGVQVGYGLNSVPRAMCLALFGGCASVKVYGADCACAPDADPMPPIDSPEYLPWLQSLRMYADGRNAATFGHTMMAEGMVGGKRWATRPDMVMSAQHMLELVEQFPQCELIGDTLPNALKREGPEFLNRMPKATGVGLLDGFGDSVLAASR